MFIHIVLPFTLGKPTDYRGAPLSEVALYKFNVAVPNLEIPLFQSVNYGCGSSTPHGPTIKAHHSLIIT